MFWLSNLKFLRKYYFRIVFLLAALILIFFAPWYFVSGILLFSVFLFPLFFEIFLAGFLLDVLSGAGFGFFTLFFFVSFLISEKIKKFVHAP